MFTHNAAVLFSWLFLSYTEDEIRKERSAVHDCPIVRNPLKGMRLCLRAPQLQLIHHNLPLMRPLPRRKSKSKYGK
jgi:hypothetical protein